MQEDGVTSFAPEDLRIIARAFDELWEAIKQNYRTPLAQEAARLRLANAVMEAAQVRLYDLQTLKADAVRALRRSVVRN